MPVQKIQVLDKSFVTYLTKEQIHTQVQQVATAIKQNYKHKNPLFIAILNGSFMFASDLFKQIDFPAEICFIKLASYKGAKSTGNVITAIGLDVEITNRHVIIIEDIVDTGKTLHSFLPQLYNRQPASIEIAVLLDKPEPRKFEVPIHYKCFTIPNKFVVGYGLDYDGYGRNYDAIYQLEE